jgi:hypothetical protein
VSKLTERKSRLVVETANTVYDRRREREILMELKPGYMILRLKGTRAEFNLSYVSALNLAIRNDKLRKQLEKAKLKKVSR